MTRPFPWETPGIDYCPVPVLVVAGDGGSAVSVGRDPGRRPTGKVVPIRRTRTRPEDNPWRGKVAEWSAAGCPVEWEAPLDDMPDEYEPLVAARNRLRLAWRHQMSRDRFDWSKYSTRFVKHDDGRWWFRWRLKSAGKPAAVDPDL